MHRLHAHACLCSCMGVPLCKQIVTCTPNPFSPVQTHSSCRHVSKVSSPESTGNQQRTFLAGGTGSWACCCCCCYFRRFAAASRHPACTRAACNCGRWDTHTLHKDTHTPRAPARIHTSTHTHAHIRMCTQTHACTHASASTLRSSLYCVFCSIGADVRDFSVPTKTYWV